MDIVKKDKQKKVYKSKPGPKKGVSNNPAGKPVGVKNKLTSEIKEKMTNFLAGNFEQFRSDLNAVEDRGFRAKLYLEAYKLVVPKPKDDEDKAKEDEFISEFKKRIFGE